MKQLLFLLLFPCLALAQYPGNAGQKITLGEQTTADGLVWRGVLNDTVLITPFSDTSAYIILDTVNNRFYNYNRATNVWSLAGGGVSVTSFSGGTTGLTPSTATTGAVTLGGTLAVANGGTGQSTLAAAGIITGSGTNKYIPTFTSSSTIGNSIIYQGTNSIGINTISPQTATGYSFITTDGITGSGYTTKVAGTTSAFIYSIGSETRISDQRALPIVFETSGTSRMIINSLGFIGIGTLTPQSGYRLHVVDSVYVGGRVSAAGYTTRSDYDLKDEIQNLNYGLNEVLQMHPVKYTYKSNGEQQLGFIAQDIGTLIPESVHFDEFMGVDYQSIIPILTKAIQEQNVLIKALEQRILTLENK